MDTAESTLYRHAANGMLESGVGQQTQEQYAAAQERRGDDLLHQAAADAGITARGRVLP